MVDKLGGYGSEGVKGRPETKVYDAGKPPTADNRVRYLAGLSRPTAPLTERQVPRMKQRHGVGMVPAGGAVVAANVVVVGEVVSALGVGHGFRPGVSQQEIQSVGGPLLKFCLQ